MREAARGLREGPPAAPALLPLAVRGLAFEAGGRRLLDGVDLDLGPRGIAVVMGPNGAGKSLLLRLLHGLVAPSAGVILWGGHPLGPEARRRQALVFQKPVLLRRSAAANLDFALRRQGWRGFWRGRRARAARREAWLARVGLEGRARQPARTLSGGEQQRLALARALAAEPEALLLDEPTASLDPASTRVIEEIVREAARAGVRVLFVTHDPAQARRLADEVVFLARGRVTEHTPAPRFFDRPRSEAAQAYLAGRLVL